MNKATLTIGRTTAMVVLAASLLACAPSVKVRSDYNPQTDFSALRTFAWLPIPPQRTGDPRADSGLLASRVERATIAELKAKGFQEVGPNAGPDFFVAFQAAVDEKVSVQSTPGYYGYRGWWGSPVVMSPQTTVHQYEVGTLILDIVDTEGDDLVWRGAGQAKLRRNDDRSSAERDQAVADAVKAILAEFPPSAGK